MMLSISLVLVMSTDEVFNGLRGCQKANGHAIAVRALHSSRYGGPVQDGGVRNIECYLPNGSVRIYSPVVPTRPVDMARACASVDMKSVPDDRNPGQMKCVSKTPPSVIQNLTNRNNKP